MKPSGISMSTPLLLALETSGPAGSLAFLDHEGHLEEEAQWDSGGKSGGLFRALAPHRDRLSRTTCVTVGLGPGSFTGIRVACACARALRLIHGCTLLGLPSFDAIGSDFPHIPRLGVFADARKGAFYFSLYQKGLLVDGPLLHDLSQLDAHIASVDLALSAAPFAQIIHQAPARASTLARLAFPLWKQNKQNAPSLQPITLRPS